MTLRTLKLGVRVPLAVLIKGRLKSMRRLLNYILIVLMFITNPIYIMMVYCNISRFNAVWLCISSILFVINFVMFLIVAKMIVKYENKIS